MNEVLEKFGNRAVKRGGLFLFSDKDALAVIDGARQAKMQILGIDGIFLEGEATRPSLDDSVDFTLRGNTPADVYRASTDFIKRHANLNLFFEIVFGVSG
jgi:hypothetical protein